MARHDQYVQFLVLTTLIILTAIDARAQNNLFMPLAEQIGAFQAGFDEANKLSGVLYVEKGNDVLIHRAYNPDADGGSGSIELTTPFAVASLTKIFTTAIVYDLVLAGRLSLDTPISNWIPEFPNAQSITVGHLLRHRSGIPHRVTDSLDEESVRYSAEKVTRLAARHDLSITPGSSRSYSTAGYAVLARVIELVEGRSYAEVLQDRVFEPAGMTNSYDLTEPEGKRPHAPPLLPRSGRLVPAPGRDLSYLVGGGSSVSTVDDMRRFVEALQDGTFERIRLSQFGSGTINWMGASNGHFSWVHIDPQQDVTVIFMGNTWGGAGPALSTALPVMLQGQNPTPPDIPPAIPAPDVDQLADYEGRYISRPGAAFTLEVRDAYLTFEDNFLVPIGDDEFWQPAWSMSLTFIRDETDQVVAIEREDGSRYPRAGAP